MFSPNNAIVSQFLPLSLLTDDQGAVEKDQKDHKEDPRKGLPRCVIGAQKIQKVKLLGNLKGECSGVWLGLTIRYVEKVLSWVWPDAQKT